MSFAYPQERNYLVLAFAVAALTVLALVRKRLALQRLAQQGIHQPGMLVRPGLQIVKCAMFLIATALLGIAVLGPQWGWIEEEVPPRPGRDVLIVLDVSRSMLAEDVAPDRLERAKADLRDLAGFLERAGGYRVGLIAFAERAALICPLTSDYRCFEEELAEASLQSLRLRGRPAWDDGTQIRLALESAGQTIDDANAAYTDVLLVSDGGDMAHETLAAAESLAHRGIAVHTFGLGDSTKGSLIPVRDSFGRPAHLRYRGELVYTHLQEAVLQAIAATTRGRYFTAQTSYRDLERQFGELLAGKESLERQTAHRQRHGIHRFAWFVGPALLLLLLHALLSDARRPGRAALEKPNYFSWVRRRQQNPSLKRKRRTALRLRFRLGFCLFLCVLCDSAIRSSPSGDPRTAFRRGNELLRQAQQAGMNADPATLLQAQRQYRECLSCQSSTPGASTLFENARHNLEMTKLLLMQIGRDSTNPSQTNANASRSLAQGLQASEPAAKDQSSSKAEPNPPQSQENSESCSKCLTGQDHSANAQKMREGGQGSPSSERDPKQAKQPKAGTGTPWPSPQKDNADKKQSNAEKTRASTSTEEQKEQSSSQRQRNQPQSQEKSQNCSVCQSGQNQSSGARKVKEGGQGSRSGRGTSPSPDRNSGDPAGKTQSANDTNSSQSEGPEAASSPSERFADDKQQEHGNSSGPGPDASGLFHAETPAENQEQTKSEGRSHGDSAGADSGKGKMKPAMDPVMKAAAMRLQASIQRIEKRRGRRGGGPASSPEDPANQNRYRDW